MTRSRPMLLSLLAEAESPERRASRVSTTGRANSSRQAGCTTTRGCGFRRSGSSRCACRGSWGPTSSCVTLSTQTRHRTHSRGVGSPGCRLKARRILQPARISRATRRADFVPKGLATRADALQEAAVTQVRKLEPAPPVPAETALLLVTDEDLSPDWMERATSPG